MCPMLPGYVALSCAPNVGCNDWQSSSTGHLERWERLLLMGFSKSEYRMRCLGVLRNPNSLVKGFEWRAKLFHICGKLATIDLYTYT